MIADLLAKMLLCGSHSPQSTSVWKVLVYDNYCRDILAPLFTVGELRKLGITLYMLLGTKRERVPDVPAVYFVQPTQENIDRICSDLDARLYDEYYINFSSSVSTALLDRLASSTARSGSHMLVSSINDQYSEFVSLDSRLLTMNHKLSYRSIYGQTVTDADRNAYTETIVAGLHSLAVTMGVVPIIRCPSSGPAFTIAQMLSNRIRADLAANPKMYGGDSVASGAASSNIDRLQRPLLVILDRLVDLTAPLHHPWSYVALINDLLGLKTNRLTIPVEGKSTTLEIDFKDEFWIANSCLPMPKVAESVDARLTQYKAEVEEVKKTQSSGVGIAALGEANADAASAGLADAIGAIPMLTRKKKQLDMHTNIGMSLVSQIKAREIDELYALEEDIIAGGKVQMSEFVKHIKEGKGTFNDKLRYVIVVFLARLFSTCGFSVLFTSRWL